MATDPALIGWQRLGGFTFRRKIDHTSLHIYSASESRPPSGKRGRGAQTSSSNTEPVLETTHDEHLVGVHRETDSPREGVKRTLSRAWREVMNKEGDVPEAVGMLCQSDLRLRL